VREIDFESRKCEQFVLNENDQEKSKIIKEFKDDEVSNERGEIQVLVE
jgi:hypothetical protein